jgi:tRNA threonylcarbamoyladenosine biosynthesis protein TsaB
VNILGLDTATAATAVCVLRSDDDRAFEVRPAPADLFARPAHAVELMPAVALVLEQAALGFDALDAVAVGVGPGAFTGLRIGIATARAIASARALPVLPVSSLSALASGGEADLILAVLDARRGEVFTALRRAEDEVWPPSAAAPAILGDRIRSAAIAPMAVGEGAIRFRDVLEAAGARVPSDDSPSHVIRALHVCRLGREAPAAAPEAVLPDYLRMPDVQTEPTAPRP